MAWNGRWKRCWRFISHRDPAADAEVAGRPPCGRSRPSANGGLPGSIFLDGSFVPRGVNAQPVVGLLPRRRAQSFFLENAVAVGLPVMLKNVLFAILAKVMPWLASAQLEPESPPMTAWQQLCDPSE